MRDLFLVGLVGLSTDEATQSEIVHQLVKRAVGMTSSLEVACTSDEFDF